MSEQQLIEALGKGNKTVVKDIYLEHKNSFRFFAKKFQLSENDISDIYQDATIALFENAIDGKLNKIKCTVKTYLFSIGKNMIYSKLKQNNKSVLLNTETIKDDYNEKVILNETPLNMYQIQMQRGFRILGEQCKKILTLFYYNGYTLDEITETMGYENKDVAKSQKSRCVRQLKKIIQNE